MPDWQRFIISHAVRDGTLNEDRISEAYRLFLRSGLLDDGSEELPTVPETVTGRADSGEIEPLLLHELKNLKNVNAIPETSALTFGKGLTVIYGHNAAGKSGFARMLSAACFSRSETKIISNVYDIVKSLQTPRLTGKQQKQKSFYKRLKMRRVKRK